MTDMPDTSRTVSVASRRVKPAEMVVTGFALQEAYWGYRVTLEGAPPLRLVIMQSIAMLGGAALIAASVALMFASRSTDFVFMIPAIMLILAAGTTLMWFASRGTMINIEVDSMAGEVREVVRNRTGGMSVISRYGFDCVGSVFIQRPTAGTATLMLRYRNTARTLAVASGSESDLARLRDRMGRDLIVSRDVA
ncbi:hypothetical protein SAMN04488004_106116 [Loktanella salsilacus]|uniref:Uncharacterized protein n=1 Tax=Loktanella salsilacus TaxID=195913 RepID=A0A1I4EAS2_9RHOB|nr:hypothetical protein [Loktanella salsilacus]SFL02289.1 hypothetical protein SAMN04488004_106116 [Loktanella salsilacus]